MKNFKKFISVIIVVMMLVSTFSLPASAYSWTDRDIQTVDEAVAEYERYNYEEVETYRYYFLMPNGHNGELGDDASHFGEYAPTWYKELPDGTPATSTAGIYWWDSGVVDPTAWIGYLPSGKDENDPDIYYADVPQAVTCFIWNNGVDGGMDSDDPIYYCAAHSVNIPCEYYDPEESPNYPDGTENFDNMIFVIDPDVIDINEFSGKQTCDGEWYYYYGNGCYGFTQNGSQKNCLRDDHFDAKGNHIGASSVEPTEAVTYPTTIEPTEEVPVEPTAPGLFDGASYSINIAAGETVRLPFTPTTSGYYEIQSNVSNGDPKCTLYDSNGNSLAYSDDEVGSNFYINYYLQKGKTYYYEISHYSNKSIVCPITLKNVESTDSNVDVDYVLYDGASFSVSVPSNGYARLSFTPRLSDYYTIESNTSYRDPRCYLYDSGLKQLDYDDDSSPNGLNFELRYYLQAGKTYYYEIREYGNNAVTCPINFWRDTNNQPTEEPTYWDEPTFAPTDWYEPTEAPTEDPYYPTESPTGRPGNASDDEIPRPQKPGDMPSPNIPYYPMTSGNVIHFDANSAGWRNFKKVFCHIWAYGGDSFYAWQQKASACTDTDGDGVWTYDLDAKRVYLEPGVLYAVIFSNENQMQTYNLLFDSTVLGDTACCANVYFENPEDSSKTAHAAFWSNQDYTVFGPELCITSIGNVVGTCIPSTTSPQAMFERFLTDTLENARTYSGKSDQRILDDVAYMLDLKAEDVVIAIEETGVYVYWNINDSYLEGKPTYVEDLSPIPKDQLDYELNVSADTIWGSFADRIYCHIYSEDEGITFYKKGDAKEQCVKKGDGTWSYNLKDNGITLEEGVTYQVVFYSTLPTIPSTPVMNINTTYLDYTLIYKFSEDAYVWDIPGEPSGGDNGGDNSGDNGGNSGDDGGETDPDDNKLMGDIDGDGVVSILDATAIQRHIAKLKLLTEEQMILAELDGDGVISVMDATAIQRKIAKLD